MNFYEKVLDSRTNDSKFEYSLPKFEFSTLFENSSFSIVHRVSLNFFRSDNEFEVIE